MFKYLQLFTIVKPMLRILVREQILIEKIVKKILCFNTRVDIHRCFLEGTFGKKAIKQSHEVSDS